MRIARANCVPLVLVLTCAVFAQGTRPTSPGTKSGEVSQLAAIRAAQVPLIKDSALCRRARARGLPGLVVHHDIDVQQLEGDLKSLVRDSEEAIYVWSDQDAVLVVAPSGDDVALYGETIVKRSWRGSLTTGRVVTYASLGGSVDCGDNISATVQRAHFDQAHALEGGPGYILFLRHARPGEDKQFPALMLTGKGVQGVVQVGWEYIRLPML